MHLVLHGGRFVRRDSADFLFSTNADCEDTKLVHKEVPTLVVFHPEWIVCVVRARSQPKDHGCGPYYICPASMRGTQVEALSFNPLHPPPPPVAATTTTSKNEASDVHSPVVSVSPTAGEEDEASLHIISTQHFNTQGIFLVNLVQLINLITLVRQNPKPCWSHQELVYLCHFRLQIISKCTNTHTFYVTFSSLRIRT